MSFNDVIESNVFEGFMQGAGFSFWNTCIVLAVACLIGIYIFGLYKNMSKAAFYSKDLNITLAGIVVVTAAIMIAMQSSLVVSLGMVGALSIVRFRTAIKNPMDLLYLFWAITAGIICGVRLYTLSAILCIIMTFLIFLLGKIPNSKASELMIIRVSEGKDLDRISTVVKKHCRYAKESSIIIKNKEHEIIYEIRSDKRNDLINALNNEGGIISINWLEHQGEMRI